MSLPAEVVIRQSIDPKLAVGSSLPKPKELLAWVITLFLINDDESVLEYSEVIEGNKIKIKQTVFDSVKLFFSSLEDYDEELFDQYQLGDSNPLCHMQLEPLQVSLQLVWKLAKINAIDSDSSSMERSGGVRVPKVLKYTTNLLIIKNVLSTDNYVISNCVKKLLYSWIVGSKVEKESSRFIEKRLITTLLILTEDTVYKDWSNPENEGIVYNLQAKKEFHFQLSDIYCEIKNDSDRVDLGKFQEVKGTLRNLKSMIEVDLHPFLRIIATQPPSNYNKIVLTKDKLKKLKFTLKVDLPLLKFPIVQVYITYSEVSLKTKELEVEYLNYTKLVGNFLDLVPKTLLDGVDPKLIGGCKISSNNENFISSRQTIYFGAPGTGKSHTIKEKLKNVPKGNVETVTFHPDYDYVSFVGGYRPISEDGNIEYKFVPQVFTNLYVKSWQNPNEPFYLVIEEINRGNCAEIFGDIFQLLDQNQDYTVTPSSELKSYLDNELSKSHEGIADGLKMPPNLSILATMNTSDQSLFPMDSAFKRRWDWEYIPINYNRDDENKSSKFIVDLDDGTYFSWLDFIEKVNDKIKNNHNLGMDKCIGNYFINPTDNTISLNTFINKAIFYLWNDVFKDEFGSDSIFAEKVTYEDFFPVEKNGAKMVIALLETLDFKLSDGKYTVLNEDTN